MVTATWNRGLLVSNADESRFVQIVVGRGSRVRRLLWLPDWNRIGLRVWSDWWLSLNWKRA